MARFNVRFLAGAMLFSASPLFAQAPQAGATTQTGSPIGITSPGPAAQSTATLKDADDEAGSITASATTNDSGPVGIVPVTPGFNASLGTTSQHDSSDGWQEILTPNVAYRFNPHLSANVGLPVYAYINVYGVVSTTAATRSTPAVDTYGYKTRSFLLGDTLLLGEYEAHPDFFDYNLNATLGLPTGDDKNGLGAGQVTYNFNNHFEKALGDVFTPDIELGIGDSPNLDDTRVRKSYVVVGTNAHFQAGVDVSLPFHIDFSSDAYEDLPLAAQTVTSTTSNGKKGKQARTTTTTASKSVGEDNGFLNTLDVPLSDHVTLSGFYNRSLRNRIDTAGFSFTFLLKAPPRNVTR